MKCSAAMIVLLAAPLVGAPPPTLVREIDLNQTVPSLPDFSPFADLAFSPDGNWLAVAIGAGQIEHRKSDRNVDVGPSESLLLVPLNGAAAKPVQINLGLRPVGNPLWSPDSATVLVQGFTNTLPSSYQNAIAKLWNLKGEELLSRPAPGLSIGKTIEGPIGGIFGFLDGTHLLARRIPTKGMPPAFETLDFQGQVVDTWKVPKHWTVADISTERGLLAVLTEGSSKTLVVDHASKAVLLSKNNPSGYLVYGFPASGYGGGSWQYFTESGKTLCSVGSVGTGNAQFNTSTECWDVDSGRRIAKFDGFLGGAPAAASSRASRLVLSRDVAFPKRDGALVFPQGERVVWDFCSGGEIASWGVPQIANVSHSADHVAISSSGRYVAETVGTLLRIYQLP